MKKEEYIYIAGPECFYTGGPEQLDVMRRLSETYGFHASLPNDTPLKLDHADLRRNADTIFKNCADSMNSSTAIICDLEFYRGAEVDGGSIYEIGMAYARGIRCYGYTRDKRDMKWKYQGLELRDGIPYDRKGRVLPYWNLPFSPNVIGSTKIIEGDYADCFRAMRTDIEEERKHAAARGQKAQRFTERTLSGVGASVIFLSGPERYDLDAEKKYEAMKELCRAHGLYPITPIDPAPGVPEIESDDPYTRAYNTFDRNQQHVRNCDILLANLNDFHGWEPESDTSFECGMAFQLGKKLYAYMDDTTRMRDRVPNLGEQHEWRDICGCNAENFDYPLNLMFSSSMKIFEGKFEAIIERVAADIGK